MKSWFDGMEPVRVRGSRRDDATQFRLELLTQPVRNTLVAPRRFRHVLLDGGMILNPHYLRSVSILRQNSASLKGRTCPLSISLSRRSTSAISSASVISSAAGGKDPSNDSARKTRRASGNANTLFSISSIADMLSV